MAKLEEITAVYLVETARRDDWMAGRARHGDDEIKIAGLADDGELSDHLEYRFFGHWDDDEKWGRQFKFKTFVRAKPHSEASVIRYLQEAPHVGPATARELWAKFQADAVRVLREEPDVACAAVNKSHFSEVKAREASAVLVEMAGMEDCSIDMLDLLAGKGFPKVTAKEAVRVWGNRAAAVIRRMPYSLMRFRGCGFLGTDKMYLDLGHDAKHIIRQTLCAWHTMARDTEGNTWHRVDTVKRGLATKISGAAVDLARAVKWGLHGKIIATRRDCQTCWGRKTIEVLAGLPEACPKCGGTGGKIWLAEYGKSRAETRIAESVASSEAESHLWPSLEHPAFQPLTVHQLEELAKSLRGSIACLVGSPGTGKTFTLAALAKAIQDVGGGSLAVCAPTGKAAVRISEAMAGYGLTVKATTIHRLLGVSSKEGRDGWGFEHDEFNPLPFRFVLVDESSMLDTNLIAALITARAAGSCILFVGDPNQLPPVGHGAPLRDLLAAGSPHGTLTEIKRNAGTIVRTCAAIRDGQPIKVDKLSELDRGDAGRNLVLLPAKPDTALDVLVARLKALRSEGFNPIVDCQVIVAVNKNSPLRRATVNERLQLELNPHGVGHEKSPFRAGDKIVCLKNSRIAIDPEFLVQLQLRCQWREEGFGFIVSTPTGELAVTKDYKVFVANGEQSTVILADEKRTVAEMSKPTCRIVIPRGRADGDESESDDDKASTGCQFDLAYAITCHKSQGSEWPIVLVLLDEHSGAQRVCNREWIYTAISRAKLECDLIGQQHVAADMARRQSLVHRKTFLREQIAEYRERLRGERESMAARQLCAEF